MSSSITRPHVVAVGDVEDDRAHVAGVLRFQTVAILGAAHAGEYGPTALGETSNARLADPGGSSGDQGIRHARTLAPM